MLNAQNTIFLDLFSFSTTLCLVLQQILKENAVIVLHGAALHFSLTFHVNIFTAREVNTDSPGNGSVNLGARRMLEGKPLSLLVMTSTLRCLHSKLQLISCFLNLLLSLVNSSCLILLFLSNKSAPVLIHHSFANATNIF